MKFGVLTGFDERVLRKMSEIGFNGVELRFASWDEMNAETLLNGDAEKVRGLCDELGLTITAIAHYVNHLEPGEETRKKHADYFAKVIDAAKALEVPVVCTLAGKDPAKTLKDSVEDFKAVHGPTAEHAEKQGIKVAFENWPAVMGYPMACSNMAISPEGWELMFDAVPSKALGLEYDPSHLFWLEVDYIKAIKDFKDRIYHMHAKDTEVIEKTLAKVGIFGHGWWRYRIPGYGGVDWKRVFSTLIDVGFDGGVNIEHEDPVFGGDRFDEGMERGYKALAPFFV